MSSKTVFKFHIDPVYQIVIQKLGHTNHRRRIIKATSHIGIGLFVMSFYTHALTET